MRLISMHADNFGCLHDYDYHFEEGLNVILHDNGWGKTTMAAFLKAMLYGFEAKRSKDITENERKRYQPWQGGTYGGTLDFEAGGTTYRIQRSFGATPRADKVKILNLDKNVTARIDPDQIGETFFQLDASAFQRSVYIHQNGLAISGAASSIHTRLNALVSQANDVAAYDGAVAALTQQIKVYEKTGARGRLGEISRQIEALEQQREHLAGDISRQDAARLRISEIDALLRGLDEALAAKKKELDTVSGEAKKKEASKKLLEELDKQIAGLRRQLDAIRSALGGKLPDASELEKARRQKAAMTELTARCRELDETYAEAVKAYQAILTPYHGAMPELAKLDELQLTYGELQAAITALHEEADAASVKEPEDYARIKAAVCEDASYADRLQRAAAAQTELQALSRKLDEQDREIQKKEERWAGQRKRYAELKASADAARTEADAKAQYSQEKAAPVLAKLEELQKREQLCEARREELAGTALTETEAALLSDAQEVLPDAEEGERCIQKIRDVLQKQSNADGLTARLDGEREKAESLKASLDQIGQILRADAAGPNVPKKPGDMALFICGAALFVNGVVLSIKLNKAMAVMAVIGAAFVVLSAVMNRQYKAKRSAYEAYAADTAAKRQEAEKRKADLLAQQSAIQSRIEMYQSQIAALKSDITEAQAFVNSWFAKWGAPETEPSEAAIRALLDRAAQVKRLREAKAERTEKQKRIDEETEAIRAGLAEVREIYPELAGKTLAECLPVLRAAETEQKIKLNKLETAEKDLEAFLTENCLFEELLAKEKAPHIESLEQTRAENAKALKEALRSVNEALSPIGLKLETGDDSAVFRRAEAMLRTYQQYADQQKERKARQEKKQKQAEELRQRFDAQLAVLNGRYTEADMPACFAKIREDAANAGKWKEKIAETEQARKRLRAQYEAAAQDVQNFIAAYAKFQPESEDCLKEIEEKAASFAKLEAAEKELEKQKRSAEAEQSRTAAAAGAEETALRRTVAELEEKRDALLVEYTQKSDLIRQADQSLEQYPDVLSEIRALYDQKQKAQNRLVMLKHAIQLITKAKEALADRYLSKVEDTFNHYMHVWLNNDAIRGILDLDFNVTIEEAGGTHVPENYSTGYCDLIDLCMRLALVDTLFEGEQPFLILDDPFVDLDAERLDKALELLHAMSCGRQIIYFICHPVRAAQTEAKETAEAAFAQLRAVSKKRLGIHSSAAPEKKKAARRSPREMYRVADPDAVLPFQPAKPDYTISNNIFSMHFVINKAAVLKDRSYELFFIDALGRVLNERQMIEVSGGKLSVERVQFCLNTRDDSGDQYELMIRESGQEDYEVLARIPFKAKLAFTGTDSFGF